MRSEWCARKAEIHNGTTVVHMQGVAGVEILGHDHVDKDDRRIRFL